jgi:hypothetical protein
MTSVPETFLPSQEQVAAAVGPLVGLNLALGIDVAWARPTVAQILALAVKFVARYLSPDSTKNITAAEVVAYRAAGIATVTVWESTATRALDGYAAGQADAREADAQRAAVGLPADHPIYFAVDTDTTWGSVSAYFAGVISELGIARVGIYGGYNVCQGAVRIGIPYIWQTPAWSNGLWASRTSIRQEIATVLSGGGDLDTAETADYGQYPKPSTPAPPPHQPDPAPARNVLEDDMAQIPALNAAGDNAEQAFTFPRGTAKTVAFFCDNTKVGGATDPGAKLRVVIWATGKAPEIHEDVVVNNKGGVQAVIPFTDPTLTHSVTATRLDAGAFPVAVEVS